jgi:hypothetical protein
LQGDSNPPAIEDQQAKLAGGIKPNKVDGKKDNQPSAFCPLPSAFQGGSLGNELDPSLLVTCYSLLKEARSSSENIGAIAPLLEQGACLGKAQDRTCPLLELENIIKSRIDNLQDFYSVGSALIKIKTAKLYKPEFNNFYRYCSDRFSLSETSVKQLVRAVNIKDSVAKVLDKSNIPLTEAHCRSLGKIKDLKMRSQVLTQVAQKRTITAKAILGEYRHMRLDEINKRQKPDLPEVGQVIRITSKQDPLSKHFNGYWGIITAKHEFTCDARVLGGYISTMHPQDFIVLSDADPDIAINLLDRLDNIICFAKANDTVQTLCVAIATRPYPLLEQIDDVLLSAVEQAEIVHNLEQAWAEPN